MLNSFQHLLPKAILTQILEILKEILKQVQDDKTVQDDIALILMRLPATSSAPMTNPPFSVYN